MSRELLVAGYVALALAAGGCKDEPPLPSDHGVRQTDLSERILGWVTRLGNADEGTRQDAALALAEVALPGQAPRLRLIVSGSDETVAAGAADALVKILERRSPGPDALQRCAKQETNGLVRVRCAARWIAGAREAAAPDDVLAAYPPTDRAAVANLLAVNRATLPALERLQQDLDESTELETRRAALRVLLRTPGLPDPALDAPLVHALQSTDARLHHLAEAVFLRRSLSDAPPPAEAAAPRAP